MPFLITRPDGSLAGIYRTQAEADAAATSGGFTSVQGAVADSDIPMGADPSADGWWVADSSEGEARKVVTNTDPSPPYMPRAEAALALLNGLRAFSDFVDSHAEGVPEDAVARVKLFLRQKRRTVRMAYENSVTIGGNAVTLTDAQFIAWATYCRFGPLDTSAVTALGVYNPEGLFDIFERAEDPTVIDPTGPITWVGLDTSQWTGGVPNRLNVSEIVPVLGTAPTEYENVDDDSWLRSDNG